MNLLDRHIFTSVLYTCAAAVGLFSFVVALPNIVRDLVGPLMAGQLGLEMFLRLIALLFPFAISFALPMGILTGVLLTLGRLSADSEVTAMRASGISVVRIARPVFLLGALAALGALYVNFELFAWARVEYHMDLAAAVRANPLSVIVPKTFIRDFKGVVVYVGEREGTLLRDIWVWRLDDQNRVTTFERSESGRVDYDQAKDSLRLVFSPAQIETREKEEPENFLKAPVVMRVGEFTPEPISVARYLGRSAFRLKDDWLTYEELQAKRRELELQPLAPPAERKEQARERMKFGLIFHDKINLSLAVFSFALIGVPLGIKVSRRETSANLGLALLLVLGYYTMTVAIKWLDRHPEYRPDLLLWLPNIIFIALGVWLFLRIDRK